MKPGIHNERSEAEDCPALFCSLLDLFCCGGGASEGYSRTGFTVTGVDIKPHQTDAFFGGQIQKMCSVVASMATAKFNELRSRRYWNIDSDMEDWDKNSKQIKNIRGEFSDGYNVFEHKVCLGDIVNYVPNLSLAIFDARAFNVPNFGEVLNYLRWRQRDAVKNSISMVAQSLYSSKELHGKNGNEQQELIFQKGQNWNDFNPSVKRGTTVVMRFEEYNDTEHGKYQRRVWTSETPDLCKDDGVSYLEKHLLPFYKPIQNS